MNEHKLKTWPDCFQAVVRGDKRAEFRKDDRGFGVGDVLILQEWNPNNLRYSGESVRARVTHIVRAPRFGLPEGHCMMSFKRLVKKESTDVE